MSFINNQVNLIAVYEIGKNVTHVLGKLTTENIENISEKKEMLQKIFVIFDVFNRWGLTLGIIISDTQGGSTKCHIKFLAFKTRILRLLYGFLMLAKARLDFTGERHFL